MRQSFYILTVLLACSFPRCLVCAADPALSLADVLARHAQARGQNAVGTHVALGKGARITAMYASGGLTGRLVWIETPQAKEWSQSTLGGVIDTSGYDGRVAWRQDANGNVRLLSTEELKSHLTSAEDAMQAGATTSHITLRDGRERHTGNYVLDMTPAGGNPLVATIDKNTFLLTQEQTQDDDLIVTTTYQQYQTHMGRTYPVRWTVGTGNRKFDEIVTITGVEDGVDAPDTLFALPTPAKNYHFLAEGAHSATVPFDYENEKIILPATLNGLSTSIILDSGASGIVLAKDFSDALKLKGVGTFQARGVGGSATVQMLSLATLNVGDALRFERVSAATIGIPHFGTADRPLAGLFGYDLLSRFVVRIDWDAQQVTFTEPDAFTPAPTDGAPLPLELDGNVPSILAQVDTLPPARFMVDTGAASTLLLYAPFVAQNKMRDKYPGGVEILSGGIGGAAKMHIVKTQQFTVGGVSLTEVPTDMPEDEKAGASHLLAGIIGAQILSRFVVTFDYPHHRMFLAPQAHTQDVYDTRTFGVILFPFTDDSGALRVFVLRVDNDVAKRTKLSRGDEVTEIDGQPVSVLGGAEILRLMSTTVGVDRHTLTIRNDHGKTHMTQVILYDPLL